MKAPFLMVLLSAACAGLTLTSCGGGGTSAGAPLSPIVDYYEAFADVDAQFEGTRSNDQAYFTARLGVQQEAKQRLQQALEGVELATAVEAPDEAPFEVVKPFSVAEVDLTDDLHDPAVRLEAVLRVTDADAFDANASFSVYGVDADGEYTRLGKANTEGPSDGGELEVSLYLAQKTSDYNEIAAEDSTWMALVGSTRQVVVVWSGLSQASDIKRQAEAHYNVAKLGYDPEAQRSLIIEEVEAATPDKRFFELHGPVKHAVTTVEGYETEDVTFDADGRLTQYRRGGSLMTVTRDADGRINAAEEAEPEDPEWAPYYSYQWNNAGFPAKAIVSTGAGTNTEERTIDVLTGDLSSVHTKMESDFDETSYTRTNYEINERDAHGNWTKRTTYEQQGQYQQTVELRTIEYFE